MRASVVIPTRGGAARLPLLLSTLAAQNYQDWEAIVVVDGDIDGSAEVVERYPHLPVRSIVFPENRGRVAALNAGFEAASGDVLIRADDDFELSPGHIAAHVAPHLEKECGVIGLPINVAPNNAYMRVYGAAADATGRASAVRTPPEFRWRLWGGNVSCSRAAFEQIGGYDHRYRGYGWEDLDFGYRLHQKGIPLELAAAADVRHHMASVTTTIRADRAFASGAARATFEAIHGQGASGRVTALDRRLWDRAVLAWARVMTQGRLRASSTIVDRCLPVLPRSLGRKLVALNVEAGSVSGYLHQMDLSDDM